ncbi:hypothetical protein GCM10020229_69780 [Kitasatospora albolonga]|uniref:hypothetical protein n=1 Tax=Kitasatospora albolonga TaxID=68173 RepID=UPI0031ECBF07
MGTDIQGFVECRMTFGMPWADDEEWSTAVDLGLLYDARSYDAFGCLFGIRNHANFEPLAPFRGMPEDVAEATRAAWDPEAHGETWISWTELAAVDWDEPAGDVDGRIHEYRRAEDGRWTYHGKAGWSREFARVAGLPDRPDVGYGGVRWPEGTEWQDGDVSYRVERMRRRDAVPPDGSWAPVWAVMRTFAGLHGGDNVRLVVWFD